MKTLKWILVCIVFLLILGGCGESPDPAPEPVPAQPEAEPVELKEFSFWHSGMMANDCFVFTVRQVEEDVILYLEENFSGGVVLDGPVDPAVLEQLEMIAGKYDLVSWDGFNESSSDVLDGSAFSLSMTLADGQTVDAQGNNAFPGRDNEAESEILQIYRSLLPDEYLTEVE